MVAQIVKINLELEEDQAWALAQLAKRFGWVDAKELSVDEGETRLMLAAVGYLQRALADAGVSPR